MGSGAYTVLAWRDMSEAERKRLGGDASLFAVVEAAAVWLMQKEVKVGRGVRRWETLSQRGMEIGETEIGERNQPKFFASSDGVDGKCQPLVDTHR